MLGAQAAGAAPLVNGAPVANPETIATAIRIGSPASWSGAVAAQQESDGKFLAVTDEEILNAYRLVASSEGVFAAVEDALDGFRLLTEMGYRPSEIVIAGDSAGGFLSLVTSLIAQRRGYGAPGALVCISPLVQRDTAGKLVLAAQSNDPLFPESALIAMERGRRGRPRRLPAAHRDGLSAIGDRHCGRFRRRLRSDSAGQ